MLTLHARIADLGDSEHITRAISPAIARALRRRSCNGADRVRAVLGWRRLLIQACTRCAGAKRGTRDLPGQSQRLPARQPDSRNGAPGRCKAEPGAMDQAKVKPNKVGPTRLASAIRLAFAPCSCLAQGAADQAAHDAQAHAAPATPQSAITRNAGPETRRWSSARP